MTTAPFPAVFELFAELLTERFSSRTFATEDTVRYTFFLALIRAGGYDHTQVSLEEPLVGYAGKEVDTVVRSLDGLPVAAFEFKYDRERHAAQNKPQRAGAILRDIARLAHIHAKQRPQSFFVYLTDRGMESYLRKPQHRLMDIFGQQPGDAHSLTLEYFIAGRPASLQKALNGFGGPCVASCTMLRELPGQHMLRIFSVEHTPDPLYNTD